MSVYRKDSSGNIVKIAGSLVQRINNVILPTAYSLVDGVEYYDVTEAADAYISGLADYTNYSFNIDTPNTTQNVYFRYKDKTLKLIAPDGALPEVGEVYGNFVCYTFDASTTSRLYIKEFGTTLEPGKNIEITDDDIINVRSSLTGISQINGDLNSSKLNLTYGTGFGIADSYFELSEGTIGLGVIGRENTRSIRMSTNYDRPKYYRDGISHDLALLDEVVNLSGAQTITGKKTYSVRPALQENGDSSEFATLSDLSNYVVTQSNDEDTYAQVINDDGAVTISVTENTTAHTLRVDNTGAYVDNRQIASVDDITANSAELTGDYTAKIGAVSSRVDDVTQTVSNQAVELSALEGTVSAQASEIGNLKTTVTGNSSDIVTLKNTTNTHGSDIASLKTTISTHTNEITALKTSTNSHESSISTINTNISTINDTVTEQGQAIARLSGGMMRLLYDTKTSPTAAEINTFVTGKGYSTPFDGIAVVVDETYHVWHYYENTSSWKDDGVDTVTAFTNSVAGTIKGSSTDGRISANSDGTGSVNGWSDLRARVSSAEIEIDALQSDVASHTGTINTLSDTSATYSTEITNLKSTTSGHTSSIATLNSDMSSVKTKVDTLESTSDTHTSEIDTLNTEVEKIKGAVAEGAVLYNTTGTNTDGALTQAAATSELNKRISKNILEMYTGNVDMCTTDNIDGICTNLYKTDGSFYTSRQFLFPDFVVTTDSATNKHTFRVDTNKFVTIDTDQTIAGVKTFTAPANISGTEQVTTKFKTSNGGALIIGKEGKNSGTMLRFEQTEGTTRLKFRSSATKGAMIWEQPEQGAQLYFDLGEQGVDYKRILMPSSAGTLALTSQIPTIVSALTNDSGYITSASLPTIVQTTGDSTTAIMSQKSITDSLDTKMDKENPTGTGSFSLNRTAHSDVGEYSFAEGYETEAVGESSHAEGRYTSARGDYSHAEGYNTSALDHTSHAEGDYTYASGICSHAEGLGTTAKGDYSHAGGKYNIADTSNKYAEIIGNGTSISARSNARTLDWEGNQWVAGKYTCGANNDEVALKSDIPTTINGMSGGTLTSALILTGGDAAEGVANIQLSEDGQITVQGTTETLFGRSSGNVLVGHSNYPLLLRGSSISINDTDIDTYINNLITAKLANYVTLNTSQTISGIKTFSSGMNTTYVNITE